MTPCRAEGLTSLVIFTIERHAFHIPHALEKPLRSLSFLFTELGESVIAQLVPRTSVQDPAPDSHQHSAEQK